MADEKPDAEQADEPEDKKRRGGTEVEIPDREEVGATSGRSHADVLRQTLPADLARKAILRKDRDQIEPR